LERALIYLAIVATVSIVLATFFSTEPRSLARETCADIRAFARDVQVAFVTRVAIRGTYYFPYRVVVNASGVYCQECLVNVNVPTLNETALYGRQRLIVNASTGSIVLQRDG
jgi:V8-like Glu-specific endopeptidase